MKSQLGSVLVGLLPTSSVKVWLLRRLGHTIGRECTVSPVVLVRSQLDLGDNVRIGMGNVFKDLQQVRIRHNSRIGQWNWITAAPEFLQFAAEGVDACSLTIGEHSAITSRHYIDCSGSITIGGYTTVAGMRSTLITHGIDILPNRQTALPITIGSFALVGSNVKLVPGCNVPSRCVVAMGSVVVSGLDDEGYLLAGNPARPKKKVTGAYFNRRLGYVLASGADIADR